MNLKEKKEIVDDLHERFERATIVIHTDYKGLNVEKITKLRSELTKLNFEFQVAKNTLLTRAAENTDVDSIKENFKGPSAVALSFDDPVALAKQLTDFAKANDKFEIKSGVMGGKPLSVEDIKALSNLPSRDVLIAQALSALNGVPTSIVRVLSAIPTQLLNVLQAIKDQKEEAA